MGDSETVVAEPSAAVSYSSGSYTSSGYGGAITNSVHEAGPTVAESTGDATQASLTYGFGNTSVNDVNEYGGDPNSVLQQAQVNTTNEAEQDAGVIDSNETASGLANTVIESTQIPGDNSSLEGSDVGRAVENATGLENGNALEIINGSTDEKQRADGCGIIFGITYILWISYLDACLSFV